MTKVKIRKKRSTFSAAMVLVLFSLTVYSQEQDCIFDRSTQTVDFIKDISEFSNFTWDDSTKTATVYLENGSILFASRGGCNHFGLSGTLVLETKENKTSDLNFWLDQAKWIAKRLFHESDYQILINCLETRSYKDYSESGSVLLVIPHATYDDFSISVESKGTKTTISIGYYFS